MIKTGDPVLPPTVKVNLICPLHLSVVLHWALLLLMSAAISSDECLYFFRAWVVSRYLGDFCCLNTAWNRTSGLLHARPVLCHCACSAPPHLVFSI